MFQFGNGKNDNNPFFEIETLDTAKKNHSWQRVIQLVKMWFWLDNFIMNLKKDPHRF